jgi:DNA-binding response OmpR family regulator
MQGNGRVLLLAKSPLVELLTLSLNHGTFEVRAVGRATDFPAALHDWQPDLLLVDLDLEGNTMKYVGSPGRGGQNIPFIALSHSGDLQGKLDAFAKGADDIITVPFSPEELVARVFALMRRTYGIGVKLVAKIKVKDLEIDVLGRRVRVGTSVLHLTTKEQALLYLFAANPGKVLDRETILDAIWGTDYVAESNLVDRQVRNLRVKLKNNYMKPRFITTVPGKGYRFTLLDEA